MFLTVLKGINPLLTHQPILNIALRPDAQQGLPAPLSNGLHFICVTKTLQLKLSLVLVSSTVLCVTL
jgi:hypothetical protein